MPVPLTVRIRRYRVQLIFIAVFFIFLFQYHKSSNFAPVTFPNEPPQQPIVHNVPVAEQEAVLPNKQLPKLNKEQDDISLDRTRPKKVAPKILEAPDVPFEEDVGVAGAAAEAATAAIAASKNEKPSSENTITNDNQPLKFPPSLGGGTITGNINIDRLNNANPNDINPKGKSSLPQLPSADDPLAPKYTPGDNIVYLPSNRHSTIRAIDRVLEPTYEDWITLEIIGTGNTNTRLDGIGGSFRPKVSKLPRSQNFPPSSIISLPSGGTTLPQIQATTFYTQSDSDRTERLRRLERAKEVFRIAWNQYRTHAWGYDEIKPVSQVAFNPFAGWAATLVDALDTMQIMGLTTEFQEAIELLKTIDFSSTFRIDIPLFETVIRYLGGLLSAYDLSNQSEKVLLDKAIQLADNLMGAFDTPNRFPRLHFKWEDTQQKYKERAGSSSNLAEFGSLSVEFTRLAQLTGNNTYYDAVDRLTQALARKAPGLSKPYLFPPGLDTSGCNLVPLDSNSESNAQKSQRNLPLAGETVVDAAESSASSSAVADGSISTIPLSLLSSNSITLSSSSTTISSPSSSFSSSSATQTTTPSATSTSTTSIPTSLSTTLTTPTSSSTSSNAVTSPTTSAGFSDSAASTSSPNIFQNQATVITQTQTPTTVAVSTVSPSTSFSVQNSASTISQVASENTVSVDSIVLVQNDPTAVTATLTQTSPGANAFFSSANNQNYIANNVYNGGNAVTPSLISVVSSNSLATGQIFIANPTPTFNINNVPTTVVLFNREEDSAGDDDESNAEDNSNKGVALERRQLGYTFQASTKVSVSGPGAVSVAAAAAAVVGGNNNGQARVYTKTVYASTPKAASTQASDVGSSAGSQAGLSGSQAGSLAGSFSGSNGFQAGSNAFSGNGFAQAFAQAGNAVAVANVNLNSPAVAFVAPTMVSSVQTLTHPSVQVQVNSGTQSAQVQSVSTTINQSPTVQSPYTITTTVKAPVQSQSPYTITTVIKASPSQETQEIQRSTQSTADVSLTSTLTSTFSSDASGSVQVQVGAQAGTSVAGQGSTQVQDFTSVEANGANIEVEATTSAQAGNVGTTTSAQGARQTTFYIASSASAFQSSPNSASVNAVGSVSTSIGDVGTSNYDTANDSDAISNDDSTTTGSLFDFSAYANKFDLSKMSLNSKFPFIKIRNSEAESSSFAKRGVIVPEIAQAESADNIEKRQSSSTTTSDGLQKVIAVYTGGQAVLTGCQSQDLVAKDSEFFFFGSSNILTYFFRSKWFYSEYEWWDR